MLSANCQEKKRSYQTKGLRGERKKFDGFNVGSLSVSLFYEEPEGNVEIAAMGRD